MLKVFLVEDELIMREGIKNNIPWEKEGFTFAGEASDGELAYPLIRKLRPDIVITDIRMPFMDGLELSRLIKKELPDTRIIILSGYDEFEYAKEAIRIGVTEYLVKPVSSIKLLEAVKEIAVKIEKDKEKRRVMEQFKEEMQELERHEKEKFLHEILAGQMSVTELLEKGERLNIHLAAGAYNIVLFVMHRAEESENTYSEELFAAESALTELVEQEENIYMFSRGIDGLEFLLLGEDAAQLKAAREAFVKRLQEFLAKYRELEYFGGIGSIVYRIREISDSYDKANRVFSYRYMLSHNQFLCWGDENEIGIDAGKNEKINLNELDFGKIDRKILNNFLRKGLIDETPHFVEDYFNSLGKDNISSMLFRQYITSDMYFATVAFVEELGYNAEQTVELCGDFTEISGILDSVEQTRTYLTRIITGALRLRDRISARKYGSLLNEAKLYIEENFDSEDISLNSVAAHVNISPSHFSSIFSQEEGQTFIEYLTTMRMNRAKELLRCSNLKSSEIGYAAGYKDPHYFSYLFKKTQNCTPKEYRMQGRDAAEGRNEENIS